MSRHQGGLSLVQLMIGLAVGSLVTIGAATWYLAGKRSTQRETLSTTVETNLRTGMRILSDAMRGLGYGVPTPAASWIGWTSYTGNPTILAGGGAAVPDTVSIANCTGQPVANLGAGAAVGATTLTLAAAAGSALDTSSRRLVLLDDRESLVVTGISGTSVTVDADAVTAGTQGLQRAVSAGASLCRVDVVTYDVDTTRSLLRIDRHDGAGPQPLLDGISNLKITPTTPGQVRYTLTLTAVSSQPDPYSGAPITRSLSFDAIQRN